MEENAREVVLAMNQPGIFVRRANYLLIKFKKAKSILKYS